MCGIIGFFNQSHAKECVSKGLELLQHRGHDGSHIHTWDGNAIGHVLHAIVGIVSQPLIHEDFLLAVNCEIYNWKELAKTHSLNVTNDAELLLHLLMKTWNPQTETFEKVNEVLAELDGVFAFCFVNMKSHKAILARDIIGEKPLWYSSSQGFSFASEQKALIGNERYDTYELYPRHILHYNIKQNTINFQSRDFFSITPEHAKDTPVSEFVAQIYTLFRNAVQKRTAEHKIGLLFSGGIDSVMIAKMLKDLDVPFTCYTAGLIEKGMSIPDDLIYARKAAKALDIPLVEVHGNLRETAKAIKEVTHIIESTNVVKVGVALPFHLCSKKAHEDGFKIMFSGLGSEEIFGGYERHARSSNINKECVSGLQQMYERDLYRDDVIAMTQTIEMRLPFLDYDLVRYALKIPEEHKIEGEHKKVILRKVADYCKIPEELAWRKKKAAQYGSKFDRAIEKIAHAKGFSTKAEYLNSIRNTTNRKLGVLWSTGKDSCYAAYLMKKHNYELTCLLTIESKNTDSFMFHTPNIHLAELHASAMNIPLLAQETHGEKEIEIEDMAELFQRAKEEHGINGIITGALFSEYQRERIEKVADKVGLTVFSPLWHKEQEQEMRELLNQGFNIVLSSVAAEGLDSSWVGREITEKDVDALVMLREKNGLNVAGEGGEFESLVIDCPLFTKKLVIKSGEVREEGKHNARYLVKEAVLEDK
ncbi:MAG: diphthine--ammonia ligase [Candidatus Woesearchaeota archaeon]